MKEKKQKKMNFKRIMSLVVPTLVLITTASVVGASFAWFSDKAIAEIATLELTTSSIFTLTFTDVVSGNNKYFGETAFDSAGQLVTKKWATGEPPLGLGMVADAPEASQESGVYRKYMLDKAYAIKSEIKLDTDGKNVDMDIFFDSLKIVWHDNETEKVLKDLKMSDDTHSDIPYGFTWFLKQKNGNTIFSPYGKFVMPSASVDEPIPSDESFFPWLTTPQKSELVDFNASGKSIYEFWIVFAPEKIFWMQYSSYANGGKADWAKSVNEIYTEEEIEKIADKENKYLSQPYYSTPIYTGAEFTFSVTINVTKVEGEVK